MSFRDLAALLMRKAAQDEFTISKLAPDPASPDEVIGFHAQQAVEKILKAVLAAHGIRYRFTHDLVELIDLLRDNGHTLPAVVEAARQLTRFAVTFRYEDISEEEMPLDRGWTLTCVGGVRRWAESLLPP